MTLKIFLKITTLVMVLGLIFLTPLQTYADIINTVDNEVMEILKENESEESGKYESEEFDELDTYDNVEFEREQYPDLKLNDESFDTEILEEDVESVEDDASEEDSVEAMEMYNANVVLVSNQTELRNAVSNAPTNGTLRIIEVHSDFILTTVVNIPRDTNIMLRSNNANQDFTLTHQGTNRHFNIEQNAVFTLGNRVILTSNGNIAGGVQVNGEFRMIGGEISGNGAVIGGGGVNVSTGGTFIMRGDAIISKNTATQVGGVSIEGVNARFTMQGGTILKNRATGSVNATGGVSVRSHATFTMQGGTILENTGLGSSSNPGSGGVSVGVNGTFTMEDGIISENTVIHGGGGVLVGLSGTFTMEDGTISGNSSAGDGGGISIAPRGNAYINGGSITKNHAANGGGIFTQGNPATTITLTDNNYNNITIGSSVVFSDNVATNGRAGADPTNPEIIASRIPVNTSSSISGRRVLNNYDINFFPIARTITFHLGDGTVAPHRMVLDGQSISNSTAPQNPSTTLPTPTRAGYTFSHWEVTTSPTGTTPNTGATFTADTVVTGGNITVTARWTTNTTRTIHFDFNGGTYSGSYQRMVRDGQSISNSTAPQNPSNTLPTPTREGYTFSHWEVDGRTGVGQPTVGDHFYSTTIVTGGLIQVKAQWIANPTVTFMWNYPGNTNPFAAVTIPHGQSIDDNDLGVVMPSDPSRTGYTFEGWSLNSTTDPAMPFDPTVSIDNDTTVYAIWSLLPPTIAEPTVGEEITVMLNNAITPIPIETGGGIADTLTVTGLPSGLSYTFDTSTGLGQITGTPNNPTQIGNDFTVTIRSENASGDDERTITIRVREFVQIEIPIQMVSWVTDPETRAVESLTHYIINHSHNTNVQIEVGIEPNVMTLPNNPDNIQLGDQPNELELYLETTGERLIFTGSGGNIDTTGGITQTIPPRSNPNNRLALQFGGQYHGDPTAIRETHRAAGGQLRIHFNPY